MNLIRLTRAGQGNKPEFAQVKNVRRLDALHNSQDFTCLMLGSMGWSTRAIARETKMSEGQVNYRLQQYRVSRKPYRNGESESAKWILSRVEKALARRIEGELVTNGHLITMGGQ